MTWITCSTPRPPRNLPGPPESSRSRYFSTRIGKSASAASAGLFLVLVMSVSMASMPSLVGRAPIPPATMRADT